MGLHRVAVVPAVLLLQPFTLSLPAQQQVRVLRHAPADTARPDDAITISFDRPVVGSLERTPDAARLVRIEPPLDVGVQWRDPTTIRIRPREPLTPGHRYRITLANDFSAIDGGRLDAPYEFTITTRGPALLAAMPSIHREVRETLAPDGHLRLVYSAPVDTAQLARAARVEIAAGPGCSAQTVRYAVHAQREVTEDDHWSIRDAGGWDRDSVEQQFRRVIDIRPITALPEQCSADLVLPSLDPTDRPEIRYPVATQPRFILSSLHCDRADCAAGNELSVAFSSPVHRDSLVQRLHLEPDVPFTVESDMISPSWKIKLRVLPQTTYRIRVDSSLTDMFGRHITGRPDAALIVGDRRATIGHQLGFFTVPRARPVLRLTHVNVDSVEVVIVPIPDSLRATILAAGADPDSVTRTVARLRDSVIRRIMLRTPHNVERITELPIPSEALQALPGGSPAALFAIRARMIERAPVASPRRGKRGELEEITLRAGAYDSILTRPAIVQVTNLIAHAKVGDAEGSVFVTDANTGRPVRGARVSSRDARDRVLAMGETDATGVATLVPVALTVSATRRFGAPDENSGAELVEVVFGADRSLMPIAQAAWWRHDDVESLGGQFSPATLAHASAFADRGVYRPGEMVYLTAVVRVGPLARLRVPAPSDSVRLRVTYGESGEDADRVVRETVLPLTAYGTVADSFALRAGASLGEYEVAVEVRTNDWQVAGTTSFRVAEYRTPEFEASLVLDTGAVFRGDTLRGRAVGRYYFGAPMRGAILHWMATSVDARDGFTVPGLPSAYTIGVRNRDGVMRDPTTADVSGVDTLDAEGAASLKIPTSTLASTFPATLTVAFAVTDLNRQAVGSQQSMTLHSSSFYIAARDSVGNSWYWTENTPRHFNVISVRPDGRRISGVRVTIKVVSLRMKLEANGYGRSPSVVWVTDTILRDSMQTRDAPTRYAFTPRTTGWHEVIFEATDERGRGTMTSVVGYVIGREWAAWGDNPLTVAMRLDQPDLSIGDSATVRFVSPFPRAEAWVTVERESLLAQRRLQVHAGESVVRFPVTDEFFPGAQVSVVLVNSDTTWGKDSTHHRIRAGYATIGVARSARALQVDVRPERPRYAPGDSARVVVAVRDNRSRPAQAQVTLWAVDEGVLALADYGRPDVLTSLYSTQATSLRFASTASNIAARRRFVPPPPGWALRRDRFDLRAGGRAVSLDSPLSISVLTAARASASFDVESAVFRSGFRSTAFYISSVVTDAAGNATTTVKLPDNLTTYRIFAVAVTAGDSYGSGESSIILTKPLLARASLPRFLRTGDAMFAGAVMHNTVGQSASAWLSATGTGLRLIGDTMATRTLAHGGAAEVRFNWRTDGRPGETAVVRFAVADGVNGDAVETSLPIRAPYSPRYHVRSGVVRGTATVRLMLPRDIDPSRSRLTLRVGTSPVPIIQAAYGRLEVYPYLCTEQLTSTGRVVLAMLRLQRAGMIDSTAAPDARTLRARLQHVVDEIARRQSYSGGIGYWSASTWTSGWLSAYAGLLLIDARDEGIAVNSAVISKVARFVEFKPNTTSSPPEETYGTRAERQRAVASRLSQHVAMLHFLRRAGVADTAQENRLIADASQMVWEDRVWLATLLAGRADKSAAQAQLARVWHDVEVAGARVDIPDSLLQTLGFPSHVRPVARLLHATLTVNPNHPRLPELVERVAQQGRARQPWDWNTQDYAAVTEALTELAISERQGRPHPTITVRSGRPGREDRVLMSRAAVSSLDSVVTLDGLLERDGDWMTLPVRVESTGGPVFYVLTVNEVPLTPPTTPDANGIVVERWFEHFDDGRPVTEVNEGDLVRGRLRITVPSDRQFVAVEDLLPAGLEVVDLSLRTSTLGPFESEASREAETDGNLANSSAVAMPWLYGSWVGGWWSPWEHREVRDDRVMYFARVLWKGSYTASYVARATTAGTFVRPPAHAEEMYNPSLGGRSEGGTFRVLEKP